MLKLIKAWLEMPVEEDDGKGGRRRTNRARRERKGTPQGSPISPLASSLYMRRLILGWKTLGHARRLQAEIVNYADDLCVLGKAPAAETLAAVERKRQPCPMVSFGSDFGLTVRLGDAPWRMDGDDGLWIDEGRRRGG